MLVAALLAPPVALSAQAPPLTSPGAAYDQAVAPVEITHRAISNWSDTETAALAVAVRQAKDACAARANTSYTGEDLIGYAKLCALGQQWPTVVQAATQYLQPPDGAKPQKTQAYAYLVEGALHMNDEQAALKNALDMLGAVPYTTLTDDVLGEAFRYMQLAYTADALVLAGVRESTILRLLDKPTAGAAASGAKPDVSAAAQSPAATDAVPVHTLYADGLRFAALQQYNGEMEAAKVTVAELEAAVPRQLPADETVPMAVARRQYAMLGTRLPEIPAAASLFSATETPRINRRYGTATILLLFPPWCAQCVRTAKDMLPAMFRLNSEGAEVHIYGLLADDPPPAAAANGPARPGGPGRRFHGESTTAAADAGTPLAPKYAAEQLRGTPTLVVAPATPDQFGATDFPFIIATDHEGLIRLLLPGAPENAMAAGSTVDQIAAHIAKQWPQPEEK